MSCEARTPRSGNPVILAKTEPFDQFLTKPDQNSVYKAKFDQVWSLLTRFTRSDQIDQI